MIRPLVLPNMATDNTLHQHAEGCYPHSCPSVQVDVDLAWIVAAWPRMTGGTKARSGRIRLVSPVTICRQSCSGRGASSDVAPVWTLRGRQKFQTAIARARRSRLLRSFQQPAFVTQDGYSCARRDHARAAPRKAASRHRSDDIHRQPSGICRGRHRSGLTSCSFLQRS